jgi:RimJ/RimL family protein N-acetyltransferase
MNIEVVAEDADLRIRRMRDETAEYELMVTWRNSPHVREHWDYDLPPLTLDSAIAEYREDTAVDARSIACMIELDARPIGFCQFYSWDAYAAELRESGVEAQPGWWGIDILIGDPDVINRGIGTKAVRLLVDHLRTERVAVAVALLTTIDNHRAIRTYEKAGLVKQRRVLDTETRHGQRLECWWMVTE